MQKDDIIYGFRLVQSAWDYYPFVKTYVWEHEASGATVCWHALDMPAAAMIGLRTPAADDTGVFHVLEHIIGHGSRKYPEHLVKHLMTLYPEDDLNAFTSSYFTAYHFETRSEERFRYYLDVWLDQIFHPTGLYDPRFFAQEGWRYALTSDGRLYRTGVVLSEMKQPHAVPLGQAVAEALCPGVPAAHEPGGTPEGIGTLTHADVLACYERYYHASNMCVCFYGNIDIEETLRFLDEAYFGAMERRPPLPAQPRIERPSEMLRVRRTYPSLQPGAQGTATFALCWLLDADDLLPDAAECFDLQDLLFGRGASAYETGRGKTGTEEFQNLSTIRLGAQDVLVLSLPRQPLGGAGRYLAHVRQQLAAIRGRHLAPEKAKAFLDRAEGRIQGPSVGSQEPEQARTAWNCYPFLAAWAKGTPMLEGYEGKYGPQLLREHLADGSLDRLAQKLATTEPALYLVLEPSAERYRADVRAEEARTEALQQAMSAEDLAAIRRDDQALRAWQAARFEAEAKERPALARATEDTKDVQLAERQHGATQLLAMMLDLEDDCYVELDFDGTQLSREQRACLFLLAPMFFARWEQRRGEAGDLLKTFDVTAGVEPRFGCRTVLYVRFRCQRARLAEALAFIWELLHADVEKNDALNGISGMRYFERRNGTLWLSDDDFIEQRILSHLDASFAETRRLADALCARRALCAAGGFDAAFPALQQDLAACLGALCAQPCTLAFFAAAEAALPAAEEEITAFLDRLPQERQAMTYAVERLRGNEGFFSTLGLQTIAKGARLQDLGYAYRGSMAVLARILVEDILEPQIREAGGAYDVGLDFYATGECIFRTAEDPHLARTLAAIDRTPDAIRALDLSEARVRAAIDAIDIVLPHRPIDEALHALMTWRGGVRPQDERRQRAEIRRTTADGLRASAPMIADVLAHATLCVCGDERMLREHAALFDTLAPRA